MNHIDDIPEYWNGKMTRKDWKEGIEAFLFGLGFILFWGIISALVARLII